MLLNGVNENKGETMKEAGGDAVTVEVASPIAIITINNPPVNALSQAVRHGLDQAMQKIAADDAITAAVIIGHGRVFIAGADIREFGKPPMPPFLNDVINAIEVSAKPVIAAIHGVALGGGLEVALGCHYRIGDPEARVGLPEVTLGIIPGAGGTQRLPRLIGAEAASGIITSGRQVQAGEAAKLGILDAIADGDLKSFAIDFAKGCTDKPVPRLAEKDTMPPEAADFFAAERARLAKRARGQLSPLRALDAIKGAVELPFKDGMAAERKIFEELRASDQSKALRHVFFAERAVSKVAGLEDVKPRPVEAIGIIGGGTMGAGIATAALRAGIEITMIECDEDARARGEANVAKNLDGYVSRGRMSADEKAETLARFRTSLDYGALKDADLAIEAVFEDLDVKKDVFAKLDEAMKPGAVLATNTSYLDVNEIAGATARPGDVIGLHFFSPAQIMRLLEIVKAAKTAPDVIATGFDLAKRLGKTGVLSGVCDGFIGNRILARSRKQADYMIEDGALPWEVDQAVEAFGMPMGPFRVMDMAGLDISWAQRKRLAPSRDPKERYVAIADRICEQGWFGQKTGRGWYIYADGKPTPNPEAEAIILDEAAKRGIARKAIGTEEIQNRILYAMINEAADIVDEGIAQRPLDIDIVEIAGYGFPRWRGGPMCTADIIGLETVRGAILGYAKDDGVFWKLSPLLERLVADGKTFSDLN